MMSLRRKNSPEPEDVVPTADGAATLRLRDVENAAVLSRRGVLWRAGLASAAGVGVLSALDDRRAEAITGSNFVVGQSNNAGNTTTLIPTGSTFPNPLISFDGNALSSSATTLFAKGSGGGIGISAQGFSSNASISTIGLAIAGSGSGSANGIHGSSSSGYGVWGSASSGRGVVGSSGTNTGVEGVSTSGPGVTGTSVSGVGVVAKSSTGNALSVAGKVRFSRSGSAAVAQGNHSKIVNVSGMTSSSLVLVTLQTSVSGLFVLGVVPAAGKFTIHLNKNAPTSTKFAWFALRG